MVRIVIILLVALAVSTDGHGRFIKPPNRSSIWRFPEFASQNPPTNYADNQLYCGGVHQAGIPGTNCGVCGDPISSPAPRANEIGGQYYRGITTGNYRSGQTIDIEVELTVGHFGYMEWRMCANPSGGENQACFNQHLLQKADGSGSRVTVTTTGMYRTQLRLPAGVTCNQCVIQWNYRAGNNWGQCEDGTSATGCGPQETLGAVPMLESLTKLFNDSLLSRYLKIFYFKFQEIKLLDIYKAFSLNKLNLTEQKVTLSYSYVHNLNLLFHIEFNQVRAFLYVIYRLEYY